MSEAAEMQLAVRDSSQVALGRQTAVASKFLTVFIVTDRCADFIQVGLPQSSLFSCFPS